MTVFFSPIREVASRTGPKVAIIFIHGFSGDIKSTWGDFPGMLAADPRISDWEIYSFGYSTRLRPDFMGIWSADAGLVRLAGLLATRLLEDARIRACHSLVLIAHSMGGLIVQRALLSNADLLDRAGHVFLYGTPSLGLRKAGLIARLKPQCRDMAFNSDFILSLRKEWEKKFRGNPPFLFLAIAGEMDQFVPPATSLSPFTEDQTRTVPGDHVTMIKPTTQERLCVDIVLNGLTKGATPAGPANALRVAVELGEFRKVVRQWWPRRKKLDDQAAVQLALALDTIGRRKDAIQLLEERSTTDTDALGTLAGRIKRRWLLDRGKEDAERAMSLYSEGFQKAVANEDHEQAFYLGINVAFMELAYRRRPRAAREMAQSVLEHCSKSEDAAGQRWKLATEGEALLLLGQPEEALARYGAAATGHPSARAVDSMRQQAMLVAALMGSSQAYLERLERAFQ